MSDKRTVLITGTNTGFGNLMMRAVARAGFHAIGTMRDIAGRNREAADELRRLGETENLAIDLVEIDVVDDASVHRGVAEAVEMAGAIDVLVNNVGRGAFGVTEAFTLEQHRYCFEVNYFGALRMDRAVLPAMRARQSGQIVHISSGLGRLPFPFMGSYPPAKFALECYADAMAVELADFGVKVAVIEPGAYPTGAMHRSQTPDDADRVAAYGPVADRPGQMFGRIGQLLASDKAPDSQEVADALLELLNTPPADWPARVVVDALARSVVDEFNEIASQFGLKMRKAYGVD